MSTGERERKRIFVKKKKEDQYQSETILQSSKC